MSCNCPGGYWYDPQEGVCVSGSLWPPTLPCTSSGGGQGPTPTPVVVPTWVVVAVVVGILILAVVLAVLR